MGLYGREIRWTTFAGQHCRARSHGCASVADAWRVALQRAQAQGWTPPRWWEWWRWGDTRVPRGIRG